MVGYIYIGERKVDYNTCCAVSGRVIKANTRGYALFDLKAGKPVLVKKCICERMMVLGDVSCREHNEIVKAAREMDKLGTKDITPEHIAIFRKLLASMRINCSVLYESDKVNTGFEFIAYNEAFQEARRKSLEQWFVGKGNYDSPDREYSVDKDLADVMGNIKRQRAIIVDFMKVYKNEPLIKKMKIYK